MCCGFFCGFVGLFVSLSRCVRIGGALDTKLCHIASINVKNVKRMLGFDVFSFYCFEIPVFKVLLSIVLRTESISVY